MQRDASALPGQYAPGSGSVDLWGTFAVQWYEDVVGLGRKWANLTGLDESTGDDLAHDALLEARDALASGRLTLRSRPETFAWLRRVIVRKAIRLWRKQLREQGRETYEGIEPSVPAVDEQLAEEEEHERRRGALRRALSRLDPRDQAIVEGWAEGIPTASLARQVKISRAGIRQRQCRALRRLRQEAGITVGRRKAS